MSSAAGVTPLFPGGVAVSDLQVYDDVAVDGLRGGSPHLHTASSEGYVVIAGTGAVHTIDSAGTGIHPLEEGSVLWFFCRHGASARSRRRTSAAGRDAERGPARIGRCGADVPERGPRRPRCVRTGGLAAQGSEDVRAAAARRRRDLAVDGYLELREAVAARGAIALEEFHERAARLVQPRVAHWRGIWEGTVAAETARTSTQLDALSQGMPGGLRDAAVRHTTPVDGPRSFGMCGRLHTWNLLEES